MVTCLDSPNESIRTSIPFGFPSATLQAIPISSCFSVLKISRSHLRLWRFDFVFHPARTNQSGGSLYIHKCSLNFSSSIQTYPHPNSSSSHRIKHTIQLLRAALSTHCRWPTSHQLKLKLRSRSMSRLTSLHSQINNKSMIESRIFDCARTVLANRLDIATNYSRSQQPQYHNSSSGSSMKHQPYQHATEIKIFPGSGDISTTGF